MGSNEQILTSSEISPEIHLIGPPEQLSRVCCLARKLPQQPCNGTCGTCKKNFQTYRNETLKAMRSSIGEPTGGGPDEEEPVPNEARCREIIEERIAAWIEEKRRIILAREQEKVTSTSNIISQAVARRMEILQKLIQTPVDLVK